MSYGAGLWCLRFGYCGFDVGLRVDGLVFVSLWVVLVSELTASFGFCLLGFGC